MTTKETTPTTAATLRQQWESGSQKQLDLVLCWDTNFAELALAISEFSLTAREISISLIMMDQQHHGQHESTPCTDPDWTSPEAALLFHALGNLPKLKSIRLRGLGISSSSSSSSHRFPLQLLTLLLYHSNRWRRLRTLELIDVSFYMAKKVEFWDFLSTLIHLRRLRRLVWSEWIFHSDNTTSLSDQQRQQQGHYGYTPAVDPWNADNYVLKSGTTATSGIFRREVLNAIFCLQKLETLSLQASGPGAHQQQQHDHCLGTIEGEGLANLCQSHRLEELTLLNFQIHPMALTLMAAALKRNDTLRLLELDLSQTSAFGVASLFQVFRHNQNITTSELWIPYNNEDWKQQHCLKLLARKLIKNTTLLELVLKSHASQIQQASSPSCNHKNDNLLAGPTAQGRSRFQDDDAKAFLNMLESNCFGPITLQLDDYNGKWLPLINLHTYMNVEGSRQRRGSSLILPSPEKVAPEMWIRLLLIAATTEKPVSSCYRVDALFQLLQQNPAIIQRME